MLSTLLLIAAVIIVILMLRSLSEKTITMPREAGDLNSPTPVEALAAPDFEMVEGEVDGEPYSADIYEDEAITVSIDADEPFKHTAEVDARKGRPAIKADDPFRPEMAELLALGANYINVTTGDDHWITADFPRSVKVDAALAEKTVRLLVRIKQKTV